MAKGGKRSQGNVSIMHHVNKGDDISLYGLFVPTRLLNISKTKEQITDFRKKKERIHTLSTTVELRWSK